MPTTNTSPFAPEHGYVASARSQPPRVLDVDELGARDRDHVEARDIEARLAIRDVAHRDARDLPSLVPAHRIERAAVLRVAPAAHFDKHEHAARTSRERARSDMCRRAVEHRSCATSRGVI